MTEATPTARIDFVNGNAVFGDTLALRLRREALSPEEVMRYARDIGSALAQVHARGQIHGSVSPYSVGITETGAAALLKPLVSAPVPRQYRAPEQVLGEKVDSRADIFAFGGLLYEMASGEPAFSGEGAEVDASILEKTPPPLSSTSPILQGIQNVITGCLEKDPGKRRQRIQNAVVELKLVGAGRGRLGAAGASGRNGRPPLRKIKTGQTSHVEPAADSSPTEVIKAPVRRPAPPAAPAFLVKRKKRSHVGRWVTIFAALVLLAGLAAALILLSGRTPAPTYRFVVDQEDAKYPGMPAVSPDGRSLTWSATGPDGKRVLWLRILETMHGEPVPNTEGASAPFWSPDNSNIGFFANGFLKKVRIQDGHPVGAPQNICPVDNFSGGGAWNKDGTILFAASLTGGLSRVASGGGAPQAVTSLDAARQEHAHLWPQFLPDGKRFIFFVQAGSADDTGIYVGAIGSTSYSRLLSSETNAVFAGGGSPLTPSSGYLLYIHNGNLVSQVFRASNLEIAEASTILVPNVEPVENLSLSQVSVSGNGTLVYQSAVKSTRQLTWFDRAGKNLGALGEPGDWGPPRISPDGKRVVAGKLDPKARLPMLWVLNAADSTASSLPGVDAGETSPVWSPDGSRIAFAAAETGVFSIYVSPVAGAAKPELLSRSPNRTHPDDWSRDGKWILFDTYSPGTRQGLFAWNMFERKAYTIVDTIRAEGYGALSPDSRWLAYQATEGGVDRVVVQAFDNGVGGTKKTWVISPNGGGLPRWRRDGGELYFMTQPGRLFAATVHPSGDAFAFDTPREVFHTRPTPKYYNLYDVSPDGQRFLVNLPMDWSSGAKIVVNTNWLSELK